MIFNVEMFDIVEDLVDDVLAAIWEEDRVSDQINYHEAHAEACTLRALGAKLSIHNEYKQKATIALAKAEMLRLEYSFTE